MKRVTKVLLAVGMAACQYCSAAAQAPVPENPAPPKLPNLRFYTDQTPLTLNSAKKLLLAIGNKNLSQESTYYPIDTQYGRKETFTLNPATGEFLLLGRDLSTQNVIYGAAHVGESDLIYSNRLKKWNVTVSGANEFV